MSVDEKGLQPEAFAGTVSRAATVGVIPPQYDFGVTALPWSTPLWLSTASPPSSSLMGKVLATEVRRRGEGGRQEIALFRPPPSSSAGPSGLAGNLAFPSSSCSFKLSCGDNTSADISSSSLSTTTRLLRGFAAANFPVVAVAVAAVAVVAVKVEVGTEATPLYFDGARQGWKEFPAAVNAAFAASDSARSASRLSASAASPKRAQTGPPRATPSRLRWHSSHFHCPSAERGSWSRQAPWIVRLHWPQRSLAIALGVPGALLRRQRRHHVPPPRTMAPLPSKNGCTLSSPAPLAPPGQSAHTQSGGAVCLALYPAHRG